jgi:hypothetical protein
MTEAEFTAVLALINQLETDHGNIRVAVHESIAAARKLNDATRAGQQKLSQLAEQIAPLKAAANAYVEAVNIAKAAEAHAAALEAKG